MLFDRRTFVLSSAALAGCATQSAQPGADDALLRLAERLPALGAQARWESVAAVDARALTPEGRMLYEAIAPGAEAEADLARLGYEINPYAVTHRNGEHRRPQPDASTLARETERLQSDAARGVIAPDFVLGLAISSVEAAAARAEPEARAALVAQAAALQALVPLAGAAASIARLPGGEAYYRAALQAQLGAPVDPRLAHEEATAFGAALQAEAFAILQNLGVVGESASAALGRLILAQRPPTDAWRAESLAEMRAVLASAPALIAPAFRAPPPAAEIIGLPAADEAGGTRGRRDGGAYIVDLGGARPRWTLASVVYHETIPGHLLQAAYEARAGTPPIVRRYASGYSEGWATYAEMLADELGGFSHDPLARLGYLHWMLFRTARIVADTGIHALGWSRARAIEELRAMQGASIAFVSIEEDVTRIAAQPGIAAAQGMAALNIRKLREGVALRRDFTLPAFHEAVLRHGPMGANGLAQAVNAAFSAA